MTKTLAAVTCLSSLIISVHAQETTAAGTLDNQMTWTALKGLSEQANSNAKNAMTLAQAIRDCGIKRMLYSPGVAGADGQGCLAPVSNSAFGTWQHYGAAGSMSNPEHMSTSPGTITYAQGTASKDGILVASSCTNCRLRGMTSGVQRFYETARDKYGQGSVTGTMPVKKGESWRIDGASSVWFLPIGE